MAPVRRRLWAWLADSPEARASFAAAMLRQGLDEYRVFGDPVRLRIHPTASVNDALFNTESGTIVVGEHAFFGFRVLVLTGTHDIAARGAARRDAVPSQGRDIVIEKGAWGAGQSCSDHAPSASRRWSRLGRWSPPTCPRASSSAECPRA
jgi:acetyltransferase-like isoleucine patch superfamily enzyme